MRLVLKREHVVMVSTPEAEVWPYMLLIDCEEERRGGP